MSEAAAGGDAAGASADGGNGRDGAADDGQERPPSLSQVFAEQFSFEQAVGGSRGMIEAVVPMTLFSVAFGVGASMRTALVAAVATAVAFAIWRLASRQPLTHAVSGLVGIALGAYLAMRTGRAENFVLPSLVKNSVQAVVFGASALTRWPLVGLVLGLVRGEGLQWRGDRARMRAYRRATWVWCAMFVVRLAVQVPLWLAGAAAARGFANVLLGLPRFGAVLWLTWAIVREHHEAADAASSAGPTAGSAGSAAGSAGSAAEPGVGLRPDASRG
jgi:hypothetical protein